jgi:hypothetical protein
MTGRNYDGVMGRHGDGEKEIVLLRVSESLFLRVPESSLGGLS